VVTWAPTQTQLCDGTAPTVFEPQDVRICNGQLRESVNDNDGEPFLEMYPKQPFDFAGRTGTIVFDVTQDETGFHGAWPELWISDKPVPHPNAFETGLFQPVPQNGVGIRFNVGGIGSWGSAAGVVVSRNYVVDDSALGATDIHTTYLDSCEGGGRQRQRSDEPRRGANLRQSDRRVRHRRRRSDRHPAPSEPDQARHAAQLQPRSASLAGCEEVDLKLRLQSRTETARHTLMPVVGDARRGYGYARGTR
jgi:hypothetical protein